MAKWRNKVEIKNMFGDETDDQTVLNILNVLIPQLETILKRERDPEELKTLELIPASEELLAGFEEVIENFKWVKDAIEDSEDPEEYGFDSWCEAFNSYLDDLYDVGNFSPQYTHTFGGEKFLWIG